MAKEILIADSDKADQEEFQKIFGTTDYHLIFSESGEDALLRAKLFKPDMIIASGTGLHEMGGLELCGVIKGDPKFKHVPFILISNIFDEISEKDRKRFQADGVISKPLDENEVLDLVDHLVEEEAVGKRKEMASEKQGDFLLDEMEEGEEEIIELMDVVDEPEPKMSIDSFVPSEKEKSFEEMTSLEPWEKLEFEEKPEEKKFGLHPTKEIQDIDLQIRKQRSFERTLSENELFEKIELEEVLDKVEQLKPSLEKEWPSEKEVRYVEERPPKIEEPLGKYLNLSEFEATSQEEVKADLPEEEFAPLSIREPKEEISEKAIRAAESVEEEELQPFFVEEPKEEISEETISVEEFMGGKELKELPKELSKGEVMEEEELEELLEEEFPEELLEEMLEEEQIDDIGRPKEARPVETKIEEIQPEAIGMETLEEFEAPRTFGEEIKPLVSEVSRKMEEVSPLVKALDKHLEEVIAKGIQDMVGDFITKILPLMTQHIIGLTAERIERMVREIVPDLAEKAIQEEIKRLQKGEKE
jgi:twitching motility two-component system response regulator PilG